MNFFHSYFNYHEYLVIPSKPINALATFINLMNIIFKEFVEFLTLVLMNDILMFSKNEEEHKEHLENMFDVLRKI